MTMAYCPKCRKQVTVKDYSLTQYKCSECGKIIEHNPRKMEDLIKGTFGHDRHG